MFQSLKETGTLVAGILGFSGLARAHFFAVNNRIPPEEGVPEPEPPERAESDDVATPKVEISSHHNLGCH